jgi:hypothetical protein
MRPLKWFRSKVFWALFISQLLSYFLITWNQRVLNFGLYGPTALSDFLFAGTNFFIIKKIATDDSTYEGWAGYTFGGVAGSMLGIFFTKAMYGR